MITDAITEVISEVISEVITDVVTDVITMKKGGKTSDESIDAERKRKN